MLLKSFSWIIIFILTLLDDSIGRFPTSDDGKVNCVSGQILINLNCYNYVGYNGFCDYSEQCNFAGGICQLNRCICISGQVFDGIKCIDNPAMSPTSSFFKLHYRYKRKG